MAAFKNIILTTDLSSNAEAALPYAVAIARQHGATIHLFHTLEHEESAALAAGIVIGVSAWIAAQRKQRQELVEAMAQRIESTYEVKAIATTVLGNPAKELAKFVKKVHADLVVIATHGRTGASRLLMGSVAERMVRLCETPVLTVRPGAPLPGGEFKPKVILLPTDFSENAPVAEPYAIDLCKEHGAKLVLAHVVEDSVYFATAADGTMGYGFDMEDWVKAIANDAEAKLRQKASDLATKSGISVETMLVRGVPAEQLCTVAEDVGADLIVIATHGHTGLTHLAFGSVVEKVVRICSVPVLSIKSQPKS